LHTFFENFLGRLFRSLAYRDYVDGASSQPGGLMLELPSSEGLAAEQIGVPDGLLQRLWELAEGEKVGLSRTELAGVLAALSAKYNFGLPAGMLATDAQCEKFYLALQLQDLALAHACALGSEHAWQHFVTRYRAPLRQAAVSITGSSSLGEELADSLYSELFGLSERDGQRRSPLATYSGRGPLMGWLRTTIAQRHVDHHRRTYRESPLDDMEPAVPYADATPLPKTLYRLDIAVNETLRGLAPDDRFLLSAYFLDQRTLLQIAQLLRVHEATVSRRMKRLTADVYKQLLKHLQAAGLSRRAAEEALGTDPRDLSINLRNVLQPSAVPPFSEQTSSSEQKRS
jgi:RNA polymerase sigma-70 factor, ECF subfamily